MPTYQYECDECRHSFEILQSMLDAKLKKCPKCGKNTLHRLIGAGSGIIFKGSGFYETDYKNKDHPAGEPEVGSKNKTDQTTKSKTDQKSSPKKGKAKKASNSPAEGSKETK